MFLKLRGKMKEMDIDQAYLAKKIGMSTASLNGRMTGRLDWKMSEMYTVLDVVHETPDKLTEFFPKNGLTVLPEKHTALMVRRSIHRIPKAGSYK